MKIFLLLLPLSAASKIIIQGRITRKKVSVLSDVLRLNAWLFLAVAAVLSALFLRELPSGGILLYALAFGAFNAAFQFFYALAFRVGSVTLTSVINNFNMVLPLLFGCLVFHDQLRAVNLIGMLLLVFPLVLIPKRDGGKTGWKWLLFTLCAFFAGGMSNVIILFVSHNGGPGADRNTFVICGFMFACVLSALLSFFLRPKSTFRPDVRTGIGILLAAVFLGGYSLMLTLSLVTIPGTVVYPVSAVLTIIFVLLYDTLIGKEKLTTRQVIGLAAGLVCIVLLNL